MTQAKTLITKKTGEYVHLLGDKDLATSSLPTILAVTATEEAINNIYPDFNWDDVELVEIVIIRKEEL